MRFREWEITALLFSLFVVLSWVDAITTQFALTNGAIEMNPFLAPFTGTVHLFLIVKMAGVAAVLVIACIARPLYRAGHTIVMLSACLGAVIPVIWNIHTLLILVSAG